MTLVTETIPNLLNGISQQPTVLRLPTQADIQENGYSSVVEGLQKRPPTEHVAKLLTGTSTNVFTHLIERDVDERYVMIIADGVMKVFDAVTGEEKTVNNGAGATAYLGNHTDYAAVTVNDYTFIANTTKVVAMGTAVSFDDFERAFIEIDQAVTETIYKVFVDGVLKASHTSAVSGVLLSTETIASSLRQTLITNLPANGVGDDYEVRRSGSTLEVVRTDGSKLNLSLHDGFGDSATTLSYKQVQRDSELPETCQTGAILEVVGDGGTDFDNYFVQFSQDDESISLSKGVWQETLDREIPYELDIATMPHVLIRESNGTFTFRQATEWLDREVGSLLTNPDPSFVGNTINYLFFWQNRLGFLSNDSMILSEAGGFFNFFRTTAIELNDADVIDVAANDEKVALFRSAKGVDESLHLFADQIQYRLDTGGELLSPKTVEFKTTTVYSADFTEADAIVAGRSVFFPFKNGSFAGIREYSLQPETDDIDALPITEHVAKYITGRIRKMAAGTHEDVVCALSTGDTNAIHVFKYFGPPAQRLQSSWSKWNYSTTVTIHDIHFMEDTLLIIVDIPNDGMYLEKIELTPGRADINGTFLTHLDRRLTLSSNQFSYDAGTDITTITLVAPVMADTSDVCSAPVLVERPCD